MTLEASVNFSARAAFIRKKLDAMVLSGHPDGAHLVGPIE
jgi:hypothetical protein